jgi:sporulation protein YlmC with PRC-barrel domain
MHLVRDLLDKRVVDRDGVPVGRVDGLLMEVREGEPPRIAALEVGLEALGHRIAPWLGRVVAAVRGAAGVPAAPGPEIPFARVREIGIDVVVDVDHRETASWVAERWLRAKIVGRIPWSGIRGRR